MKSSGVRKVRNSHASKIEYVSRLHSFCVVYPVKKARHMLTAVRASPGHQKQPKQLFPPGQYALQSPVACGSDQMCGLRRQLECRGFRTPPCSRWCSSPRKPSIVLPDPCWPPTHQRRRSVPSCDFGTNRRGMGPPHAFTAIVDMFVTGSDGQHETGVFRIRFRGIHFA